MAAFAEADLSDDLALLVVQSATPTDLARPRAAAGVARLPERCTVCC